MTDDMMLSVDDAARLLGVTPRTVQRRCRAGKYPGATEVAAHGGKQYRIPLASLPDRARNAHLLEHDRQDTADPIEADEVPQAVDDDADEAAWDWYASLPPAAQAKAKRNLEIMRDRAQLQMTGAPAAAIDQELARRYGITPRTVRRLAKRIEGVSPHMWLPALAPDYRGRASEAEFTPDAWKYIRESWGQQSQPSLRGVYDRAVRLAQRNGWTIPSYDAVRRRIDGLPATWKIFRRRGETALAHLYPAVERDYRTLALHELWVADGHQADVFCRWPGRDGNEDIARPIVVAWEDLRSRYLLGWAVGRVESADLIRLAFKAAAEKSRAIPSHALIDNGRGFASKLLTGGTPNRYRFRVREEDIPGTLTLFGVEVHWAQPGWGQSKPIEPAWRLIADRVSKRPEFRGAYCGNRPANKPEEFDRDRAVPIDVFMAALREEIDAYHRRGHRGDGMDGRSPLDVYEALIGQTAVRRPTAQQLRLCLLAAEDRRPTKKDHAFMILGNRYWAERCADLDPRRSYVVRFDPEDAAKPISIYDGDRYLFDADLVARTGFFDQAAAKEHIRSRRRFQKAQKDAAKSQADMRRAASWGDAGRGDVQSGDDLPPPKVIIPARPPVESAAPETPSTMSDEEYRALLHQAIRARKAKA